MMWASLLLFSLLLMHTLQASVAPTSAYNRYLIASSSLKMQIGRT